MDRPRASDGDIFACKYVEFGPPAEAANVARQSVRAKQDARALMVIALEARYNLESKKRVDVGWVG